MWFSWLLIFLIFFFMFVHDAEEKIAWFYGSLITVVKFTLIFWLSAWLFSAFTSERFLILIMAFFGSVLLYSALKSDA